MNTVLLLAAGAGGVLGLGLTLAVRTVVGPAPMDASAALDHLAHRGSTSVPGAGWRAWRARIVDSATRHSQQHTRSSWLGIPVHDLALLKISPSDYVTARLRWLTGSLAVTILLAIGLAAVGVPLALLVGIAAAGVLTGVVVPVLRLRDRATAAREDAQRALPVYLDLVAQQRGAGHAPGPALREAASVGDHWLLTQLHSTLLHAEHSGHSPWDAFRDLGTQTKLPELVAVADLAATAADGAAIYASLTTHAASLRSAAISTDKAEANARTERLTLPVTLLLLGVLLLACYPALTRLLG